MSRIRIKQISGDGGPDDAIMALKGGVPVWQIARGTFSFGSTDVTSGYMNVQHDLGRKYVHVSVYDEYDNKVYPDNIKLNDENSITIGLSSFEIAIEQASAENKTWTVVVS